MGFVSIPSGMFVGGQGLHSFSLSSDLTPLSLPSLGIFLGSNHLWDVFENVPYTGVHVRHSFDTFRSCSEFYFRGWSSQGYKKKDTR